MEKYLKERTHKIYVDELNNIYYIPTWNPYIMSNECNVCNMKKFYSCCRGSGLMEDDRLSRLGHDGLYYTGGS